MSVFVLNICRVSFAWSGSRQQTVKFAMEGAVEDLDFVQLVAMKLQIEDLKFFFNEARILFPMMKRKLVRDQMGKLLPHLCTAVAPRSKETERLMKCFELMDLRVSEDIFIELVNLCGVVSLVYSSELQRRVLEQPAAKRFIGLLPSEDVVLEGEKVFSSDLIQEATASFHKARKLVQ